MAVFVFGSNESGYHGAGAAKFAHERHGAVFGVGFGPQGNSFAIPTKDWNINTLPLAVVQGYVNAFIRYAQEKDYATFHLTKIGCGLAGFTERDIAPLFTYAPDNVILIDDYGNEVFKASEWLGRLDQKEDWGV